MTHNEREAALLVKIARLRSRATDLVEELSEAGLQKTANSVVLAGALLDEAKQTLMSAIRKAD